MAKKKEISDSDKAGREELIGRIEELENLLAKKKAESQKKTGTRLKFGTDGIPVLDELVDENTITDDDTSARQERENNEVINEIIDKLDQEISQDLDELIVTLKDSIIDEVKTRLLKELAGENKGPAKR